MLKKFTKTVNQTTKKVKEIGTKLINGRNDLSPSVKKLLSQYGDVPIVKVVIGRHALASPLVSAINAVSGFQFKKNIEDSPYDKLYHLFLKITLLGNTNFNLEKTEVISLTMNPSPDSTDEFMNVDNVQDKNLTLNKILQNCKENMGTNFYTYASASNNCHDFCLACLESNFMGSPSVVDFVKQNTLELFENTGVLKSVANGLTDFAGRLDVLKQGGNLQHTGSKIGILHHRNQLDFNNETKKVFNLMSVSGSYQVIGSADLTNIIYNSDYDLQEFDNCSTFTSVYNIFKNKFINAKKNINIFITDFKCGQKVDGSALRWSYNDMMLGTNNGISFEDAIKMKKMIKLDVICLVSGRFLEFSENYYLKINSVKYYDDVNEKNIKIDLVASVKSEAKEKNYMKSLKRIFSVAVLEGNDKIINRLLELFNGPVGFINKQLTDLKIIQLMIDQKFRKVKRSDVISNLQVIKQNLSTHTVLELPNFISQSINTICNSKLVNLKQLIDVIDKIINNYAYKYISDYTL